MIERRQTYYSDKDSNPHTLNTITRLPRAFVPAKGTRQQTSVMFIILPMNPEVHMSRPSLISERSPHSTREGYELTSARWSTSKQLDYKCTPLHSAGVCTSVLGFHPVREGNPDPVLSWQLYCPCDIIICLGALRFLGNHINDQCRGR